MTAYSFWCMNQLMNVHGMVNFGFKGPQYTCSNKGQDAALIQERLDRRLANCKCRLMFLVLVVSHLVRSASDYLLVYLDTLGDRFLRVGTKTKGIGIRFRFQYSPESNIGSGSISKNTRMEADSPELEIKNFDFNMWAFWVFCFSFFRHFGPEFEIDFSIHT